MGKRRRHHPDQLDVFGYRPDDEPVPIRPSPSAPQPEPTHAAPVHKYVRREKKPIGILPTGAPRIQLPAVPFNGFEVTLDIEPEYDVELCIVHRNGFVSHRRRVLVRESEIEWHVAALFGEAPSRPGTRVLASDRTRGIRWVLTCDRKGEWSDCVVKPCKTSSPYRKSVLA